MNHLKLMPHNLDIIKPMIAFATYMGITLSDFNDIVKIAAGLLTVWYTSYKLYKEYSK